MTKKFLSLAALALMFIACDQEDNFVQQPAKANGIPFTATISVDKSATTRALAENGTTINATWATGEKVALIYSVSGTAYNTEATVTAHGDGTATISATLQEGATDGSDVTIIYPASAADGTKGKVKSNLLAAQDGTLTGNNGTSIAEKYDVRKGAGKLRIYAGGATVNNGTAGTPVTLTNQNAIFKLRLKDIDGTNDISAKSVVITDMMNGVITVTPASGYDNVMYVALPASIGKRTIKFLITGSDNKKYYNMASGSTIGANFYTSTLKLATVGDVILSTGRCAKAGTADAVAMIAYLGNGSNCTNGLALQLSNNPPSSKGTSAGNDIARLTSVPGGGWRLPTMADFQNMFLGCAISGDVSSASRDMSPIRGFKEKLAANGITKQQYDCWTSTESSTYFDHVRVEITLSSDTGNGFFRNWDYTKYKCDVLGCLSF